jgi:hypothetical protein
MGGGRHPRSAARLLRADHGAARQADRGRGNGSQMAVIVWHLLTNGEDYAFGRPALLQAKLRQMEIKAGLPSKRGGNAAQGGPAVQARRQRRRASAELQCQGAARAGARPRGTGRDSLWPLCRGVEQTPGHARTARRRRNSGATIRGCAAGLTSWRPALRRCARQPPASAGRDERMSAVEQKDGPYAPRALSASRDKRRCATSR